MDATVGKAYTLRFDFIHDGEYVVPDVASVFYSAYDNAGVVITGHNNVAVTTNTSTQYVSIAMPSGVQTVAGGKLFEHRRVTVDYLYLGKSYSMVQSYLVTPALNHHITPRDVISYLAIKDGEILEPEVELTPAYFEVRDSVGASAFDAALISGGMTQLRINDAIKFTAALRLIATIELRALRRVGGDSLNFARFDKIDFPGIKLSIQSDLSSALQDMGSSADTPSLLVLSDPDDVFTGA